MKNFEKYIDRIIEPNTVEAMECNLARLRTFSNECEGDCDECIAKTRQWLLEESKEPIQLSHDEYVILKNLPSDYKYICRGLKNWLGIFGTKPYKKNDYWDFDAGEYFNFSAFENLFQFIKWEGEPYEIAKLIEDYEKEHECG